MCFILSSGSPQMHGFSFCFDGKLFAIGTIRFLIEKMYLLSDIDNFSPFGKRYSAILIEEYLIYIPLLPLFPKRYSSAFWLMDFLNIFLNSLILDNLISSRDILISRYFRSLRQLDAQSPLVGFWNWRFTNLDIILVGFSHKILFKNSKRILKISNRAGWCPASK